MKKTTMKNEPKVGQAIVKPNKSKYGHTLLQFLEPRRVCYECGVTANVLTCLKKYKSPPKKLSYDVSTYWNGECGICGEVKSVTSERDFFYPDFSLLEKNWILKLKK